MESQNHSRDPVFLTQWFTLHRIHVPVNACESFYLESAIFPFGNFHNV